MRLRLTHLLISLLLGAACAAQQPTDLDGWAQRLKLFGEKLPQEEVFLHMDNTSYYLGDTLYFKAYTWLSDERPSSLSHLLYVELLNNDGYLVERQKIELKGGQGTGSFVLPDSLYGGYYELRAYTRWQLNWGVTEHPHTRQAEEWFFSKDLARDYYRDYEKLYSRVFPVYDRPLQAGDYAQEMTLRPMRRQVAQTEQKPRAVVRFYPEGGSLVAGVPNRVAFEANDENGKHLQGKLRIVDGGLNIEAETISRGRGMFTLEGTAGKALFEWEGGTEEVSLPKAVEDGVALQAEVGADGIRLQLRTHGTAASEPLGLTASCHGIQKDFQQLGQGATLSALVPLSKLPTGVIQLTVFNAQGRIYADRLVFVRQPGFQPQNITFSGLKSKYQPYEEVNLSLQCPSAESGGVSLAVRDAGHSDYTFDTGNILTEMLLSSQIRGFVEHPEHFFEADDPEHRTALDLLLMVQGWRRYSWHQMATPGAFTLTQPYERTEVITGQVMPYQAEQQEDIISRSSFIASFIEGEDSAGTPLYDRPSSPDIVTLAEKNIVRLFEDSHEATTALTALWGHTHEMNAGARYGRTTAQEGGRLKNEVLLHAEFVQPGVKDGIVEGDMTTFSGGQFKIEAPRFYEGCYFSLAASDTTRWKPGKQHTWVAVNEDNKGRLNYPEFYVRIHNIHPRFPRPYDFYQTAIPKMRPLHRPATGRRPTMGEMEATLDEIVVRARHTVMRKFDSSKPAFVIDAQDAFNQTIDAGLCPGYFTGARRFVDDVARTFIGDMGMERAYLVETRTNSEHSSTNIALFNEAELHSSMLDNDSRFSRLKMSVQTAPFKSPAMKDVFDHLPRLDMVYIYTDYAPRCEGDPRYSQADQPLVTIDLRTVPGGGQRMTWRDRHMPLTGFAVCDDFYQPDYSRQRPAEPTDYRRTLYWNPNLLLDANGTATVRFFTGSREARLQVSAEGLSPQGQPLTGTLWPTE